MLGAQAPTTDNAGYGAIYRDVELDAQTGNVLHLGVAVSPLNGHVFVSATGSMGLPPHKLFEFDAVGALLATRSQPAVQSVSAYGMRDLECDGQSILGGSEVGVSVVSPLGLLVNSILTANGPQPIVQPIGGAALLQLGVIRSTRKATTALVRCSSPTLARRFWSARSRARSCARSPTAAGRPMAWRWIP
jgi:hypothetical protein